MFNHSILNKTHAFSKSLDTEFICQVLQENHLLSAEQVQQILAQGEKHRKLLQTKVLKDAGNGSGKPMNKEAAPEQITIVDVLTSMRLRLPLNEQAILTEEMIMKTLATHWKLPFVRLDPLKLNLDVVTSKISEPFAMRHLIVPMTIDEDQELLSVAVVNPWDIEALDTVRKVSGLRGDR